VERDLTAYLDVGAVNTLALDAVRRPSAQPARVESSADFEARHALAEMLGNYLGRMPQAEEA
jgi:hypothetical protein